MEKKDRFRKLVNYLIWKHDVPFNSALKTIGTQVGISASNLSVALNGNERFLTNSLIQKINNSYGKPFHEEWLVYGTGDMLRNPTSDVVENIGAVIESQQETIKKLTEALAVLVKK